ncbi:MAG: hypothetical protein E7249_19070 [Paenibacillaceae bacterium]|nr:hypothetical protein [Paenibacillaceae bacterium]
MRPEHLYYKEVNSKDGNYYRRWASVVGSAMSELVERVLKSSKHEEQAYNACAGILHRIKTLPQGIAEEAARKCIEMNSCKYFTFKQMLKRWKPENFRILFRDHFHHMKTFEERITISKGGYHGIQAERMQLQQ